MSIAELYKTIAPVGPRTGEGPAPKQPSVTPGKPSEFEKLLQSQTGSNITLSQHAETRIRSRSIPWDTALEKRISEGIDAASAKGSKEALILADNVAFIANVKSRTIVTALDKTQMKEKVFTNIDSAVLV